MKPTISDVKGACPDDCTKVMFRKRSTNLIRCNSTVRSTSIIRLVNFVIVMVISCSSSGVWDLVTINLRPNTIILLNRGLPSLLNSVRIVWKKQKIISKSILTSGLQRVSQRAQLLLLPLILFKVSEKTVYCLKWQNSCMHASWLRYFIFFKNVMQPTWLQTWITRHQFMVRSVSFEVRF